MISGWPIERMTERFNSGLVIAVSIGAALGFAAGVSIIFEGDTRWFWLYYYVPITVPFVAFLFDRVSRWHRLPRVTLIVDVPVLTLAFTRAVVLIPLISGHALFLTYAVLTTQSMVARVTAALVLIEVILIKIFVWHDITLIGGMALGIAATWLFRQFERLAAKQGKPSHSEVSYDASQPDN